MRIKIFVDGWITVMGRVNEFCKTVEVVDIQTHLMSDNQIAAVVVYKEGMKDGR